MANEMRDEVLPLEALSIGELFCSSDSKTFEVPIYQRNYAWGQREISTLVQDVYDAMCKDEKGRYYIGTLVAYGKDDGTLEIIDGQQRLTTIFIILNALEQLRLGDNVGEWANLAITSNLTYRARRKSTKAINELPDTKRRNDKESAILDGFDYATEALKNIVVPIRPKGESGNEPDGLDGIDGADEADKPDESDMPNGSNGFEGLAEFARFFKERVTIILYKVPEDVDLNHYFEIMNSRGEQLEQHEIVKADLISVLGSEAADGKASGDQTHSEATPDSVVDSNSRGRSANGSDSSKFAFIWDCCSRMGVYIQRSFKKETGAFSKDLGSFIAKSFDSLKVDRDANEEPCTLEELISARQEDAPERDDDDSRDQFDPIIDFPNFLLIVLKLTCIQQEMPGCTSITLDDKNLKEQFDRVLNSSWCEEQGKAAFVKAFTFNLLKCRFYLDNCIVHRDNGKDDAAGKNPWELERYEDDDETGKTKATNLFGEDEQFKDEQNKCKQLLSMFEVTFSPHQRKNYLLYCLLYLMREREINGTGYRKFLSRLAKAYLYKVYFGPAKCINARSNAPIPGIFDEVILGNDGAFYREETNWPMIEPSDEPDREMVQKRLGNGSEESNGVPLFVFNYLDYLIWEEYYDSVRGKDETGTERDAFAKKLGCKQLNLGTFRTFYFTTTRSSLEHFYSRSQQEEDSNDTEKATIERFGNFAMISPQANSAASDWRPETKCGEYARFEKKGAKRGNENAVSINSLKFRIMLAICAEKKEWARHQIEAHQDTMVNILLNSGLE